MSRVPNLMHRKIPNRPCDGWGLIAYEGMSALLGREANWIDKFASYSSDLTCTTVQSLLIRR